MLILKLCLVWNTIYRNYHDPICLSPVESTCVVSEYKQHINISNLFPELPFTWHRGWHSVDRTVYMIICLSQWVKDSLSWPRPMDSGSVWCRCENVALLSARLSKYHHYSCTENTRIRDKYFISSLSLKCCQCYFPNGKNILYICDQATLWMDNSLIHLFIYLSVCPSTHLSICLSVTHILQCSCHIIVRFSGVITNDGRDDHAKDQGQTSKVKVTEVKIKFCPSLGILVW